MISISICVLVYLLIAWAVSSNLSLTEIIQAKDYALAEAARPAFGDYGLWISCYSIYSIHIIIYVGEKFFLRRTS